MGANNRMSHRVGDTAAAFRTQLHQLPRAVTALVDMDCFQAVEAAFGLLRQFVVGEAHIGVLGIAAQVGQAHGVQNCGLWRAGCIRVVSVIAFAGNVTPPVGIEILVRDVVDERTLGQRKAGIVLREDFSEELHRLQKLRRAELLIANGEHRMIREGLIQGRARCLVNGLAQVNAADFRSGMRGKRLDRK